jgi:hypothetical protein
MTEKLIDTGVDDVDVNGALDAVRSVLEAVDDHRCVATDAQRAYLAVAVEVLSQLVAAADGGRRG